MTPLIMLKAKYRLSNIPILAPESPASKGFLDNPQQHNTEQHTCPSCGTIAPHNITLQPPQSPHYASLKCCECDTFIKWLPKPEKERERVRRSRIITAWLNNPRLSINDWERDFLTSISTTPKLSPDQQNCFYKISNRLGGIAA